MRHGVGSAAAALAIITLVAGCLEEQPLAVGDPIVDGPIPDVQHVLVTPEVPALTNASLPSFAFDLVTVGQSAPEPTLGVDSAGNVFFVAGTHVMRTSDLGATWQDVGPKVATVTVPPTTLDPMLYVDPVTDRVFVDQLYVGCSFLSYSDDQGATWVHNPAACGLPGDDHQTIAAGPAQLPAPLYEDRAFYFCANQFADATCAVSLDGGHTFPITRPVFGGAECGGITGHLNVGPDGTLYLPAWRCDTPWLAISRDGGLTWTSQRMASKSSGEMDPAVAVGSDDSVYYFWMEKNGHPWLMVSKDAGQSWGAPIDVAFEGLKVANLPAIVAGDGGRIAFTYIATTTGEAVNPAQVDPQTPWNLYVTLSTDALSETPHFTSVQLNPADDPIHRGACGGGYRCGDIVDFMDIAMGPDGRVYASSTDACGTQDCLKHAPAPGATPEGFGVLGVLRTGPSLLAAHEGFWPEPEAV